MPFYRFHKYQKDLNCNIPGGYAFENMFEYDEVILQNDIQTIYTTSEEPPELEQKFKCNDCSNLFKITDRCIKCFSFCSDDKLPLSERWRDFQKDGNNYDYVKLDVIKVCKKCIVKRMIANSVEFRYKVLNQDDPKFYWDFVGSSEDYDDNVVSE